MRDRTDRDPLPLDTREPTPDKAATADCECDYGAVSGGPSIFDAESHYEPVVGATPSSASPSRPAVSNDCDRRKIAR